MRKDFIIFLKRKGKILNGIENEIESQQLRRVLSDRKKLIK